MWVLKGWDREEFGSSFVGLKLTLLTSCFFMVVSFQDGARR